jgi:hypothetical protein
MLSLLRQLRRWLNRDDASSKIATLFLMEANLHQNLR